jgi:hypothetical protein
MAVRPHFAFPLTLDATGHPRVVEQDSVDHIADQVEAALLTRIGQGTPLRPSWGTPDLTFRQRPLDTESLRQLLLDLVPSAGLLIDQDPGRIDALVARLNIYVTTGG